VSSNRGIKLQPNKAYRLTVGGALVWVEEVRPYPTGPIGVILPEQPDPEAYAMGIPGSTKAKGLGCFAPGEEVELSEFNKKFVADLPRLRREGTTMVAPPRSAPSKGRAKTRTPGRSPRGASQTYSHLKDNPAFRSGSQPGFVQAAIRELGKPTKQEIADHIKKQPGWKWAPEAAIKAARWYTDVLVREGFAKEN
jgi:hypothetical protein